MKGKLTRGGWLVYVYNDGTRKTEKIKPRVRRIKIS